LGSCPGLRVIGLGYARFDRRAPQPASQASSGAGHSQPCPAVSFCFSSHTKKSPATRGAKSGRNVPQGRSGTMPEYPWLREVCLIALSPGSRHRTARGAAAGSRECLLELNGVDFRPLPLSKRKGSAGTAARPGAGRGSAIATLGVGGGAGVTNPVVGEGQGTQMLPQDNLSAACEGPHANIRRPVSAPQIKTGQFSRTDPFRP
jgi:hypothetical protein